MFGSKFLLGLGGVVSRGSLGPKRPRVVCLVFLCVDKGLNWVNTVSPAIIWHGKSLGFKVISSLKIKSCGSLLSVSLSVESVQE